MCVPKGNVGPKVARRSQDGQSQQIGGDAEGGPELVNGVGERREILYATLGIGVLDEHADQVFSHVLNLSACIGQDVSGDDADAKALGTRLEHGNGLWMDQVGDEEGLVRSLLSGRG